MWRSIAKGGSSEVGQSFAFSPVVNSADIFKEISGGWSVNPRVHRTHSNMLAYLPLTSTTPSQGGGRGEPCIVISALSAQTWGELAASPANTYAGNPHLHVCFLPLRFKPSQMKGKNFPSSRTSVNFPLCICRRSHSGSSTLWHSPAVAMKGKRYGCAIIDRNFREVGLAQLHGMSCVCGCLGAY